MPPKRAGRAGNPRLGSGETAGSAAGPDVAGGAVGSPGSEKEGALNHGFKKPPQQQHQQQQQQQLQQLQKRQQQQMQQQQQQQQQQQVYQHQLQLLRLAQQQRPTFPWADLIRTGFIFVVGAVILYGVYCEYGLAMTTAVAGVLYMCGFFRFVAVWARWIFKTAEGANYSDALRRADIMTEPIVKKVTHFGENATLHYGCSCMQGWRRTMEDAHTMLTFDDGGFFGVYDGHSGSGTSKFCGVNLYQFVADTTAFKEKNYTTALYDGFIAIDRHLLKHGTDRSGCTAVVLFIKGDDLYCANAGDSRCILCRDGEAFPLSTDHKPYLPTEQSRIERAGGYVWGRRVNGILALSRAIGDFSFKQNAQVSWDQQAVTSAPEVRTTRLNRDKDEFAVIACDGIWDVLTNEQVIDFVRPLVQRRVPLGRICEQLMDLCLAPQPFGLGCDNMSVIIVQFKRTTQGTGTGAEVEVGSATRTSDGIVSSATVAGSEAVPIAGGLPPNTAEATAVVGTAQALSQENSDIRDSPVSPPDLMTPPGPEELAANGAARGKPTTVVKATEIVSPTDVAILSAESPVLEQVQLPTALLDKDGTPVMTTTTRVVDSPDAADALEKKTANTDSPAETAASSAPPMGPKKLPESLHSEESRPPFSTPPGSAKSSPKAGPTTPTPTSPSSNPRGSSHENGRRVRSTPPARASASSSTNEFDQLKDAVTSGLQ